MIGYRPHIYTPDTLDCPVIAQVDVVIVGGSQSGVAAAVSGARALAKMEKDKSTKHSVLLIEQNTYLGGQSVAHDISMENYCLSEKCWTLENERNRI